MNSIFDTDEGAWLPRKILEVVTIPAKKMLGVYVQLTSPQNRHPESL